LVSVYQAAVASGATTVNIPDTVGYAQPQEFAALVHAIRAALPDTRVKISVHCHNDLGLAVANTLAAVGAGADQVHVTVNGLGERGGNASLEETVMALRCRADWYRVDVGVRQERLVVASRIVSELTGIPVQPNKAIVGANAFAHASGIHQDGVLKDPRTYEIMSPQSVGWEARRIVVSKLSGRRGLAARLAELGVPLDGEALDRAYALGVRRPDLTLATMDHNVPTDEHPPEDISARQIEAMAVNAREFGIRCFPVGDANQGIVHVISPQLGLTQPGMTIVCGDSHTSTHGALGALAWGIGTSEIEHVLATQTIAQAVPGSMAITVDGTLPSDCA